MERRSFQKLACTFLQSPEKGLAAYLLRNKLVRLSGKLNVFFVELCNGCVEMPLPINLTASQSCGGAYQDSEGKRGIAAGTAAPSVTITDRSTIIQRTWGSRNRHAAVWPTQQPRVLRGNGCFRIPRRVLKGRNRHIKCTVDRATERSSHDSWAASEALSRTGLLPAIESLQLGKSRQGALSLWLLPR